MKVAINKCETYVSKADGLRQAYRACTKVQETDSPEKTGFDKDAPEIKRVLTKALKYLSNHPDLISSEEADAVCDLVDALNIWVTDYRARTDRHSLNKHRDTEFEMPITDEKESPTSSQATEFATAE